LIDVKNQNYTIFGYPRICFWKFKY